MSDAQKIRRAGQELVAAIKRFQDAVDLFDASAAAALGINTTDLRCLTALHDRGPMTAGEVAAGLGLTRGATTTALDRLQRRNYIARRAHAEDGRSVVVELTENGRRNVEATWGPMRKQGRAHLGSYTLRELELLSGFFERSIELQTSSTRSLSRPVNADGDAGAKRAAGREREPKRASRTKPTTRG